MQATELAENAIAEGNQEVVHLGDALKKLVFPTLELVLAKWDKPVFAWNIILSQLRIHFKERIEP